MLPPYFDLRKQVDMTKVEMPAIMMWAKAQLTMYLGFEDEVVEGCAAAFPCTHRPISDNAL